MSISTKIGGYVKFNTVESYKRYKEAMVATKHAVKNTVGTSFIGSTTANSIPDFNDGDLTVTTETASFTSKMHIALLFLVAPEEFIEGKECLPFDFNKEVSVMRAYGSDTAGVLQLRNGKLKSYTDYDTLKLFLGEPFMVECPTEEIFLTKMKKCNNVLNDLDDIGLESWLSYYAKKIN